MLLFEILVKSYNEAQLDVRKWETFDNKFLEMDLSGARTSRVKASFSIFS
jgi:hypothetical protein